MPHCPKSVVFDAHRSTVPPASATPLRYWMSFALLDHRLCDHPYVCQPHLALPGTSRSIAANPPYTPTALRPITDAAPSRNRSTIAHSAELSPPGSTSRAK